MAKPFPFCRDCAVPAFEKALLYYDTRDLPQTWDKEELLGEGMQDDSDEVKAPSRNMDFSNTSSSKL